MPGERDVAGFTATLRACCAALQPVPEEALAGAPDGPATQAAAAASQGGFALLFARMRRSDQRHALLPVGPAAHLKQRLREGIGSALRREDHFALIGTDQVLLLLPGVAVPGVAQLAMHRLSRALHLRTEPGPASDGAPEGVEFRPAIGCALAPAHGTSPDALLDAAYAACRASYADPDGFALARPRVATASDDGLLPALRQAIQANQLVVHYQPKLDLHTGDYEGMEALVRWPRPPGLPPVSPARVAELAEFSGLMGPLTDFVLDTALRDVADLHRAGIPMSVAVNLSATGLSDVGLPLRVGQSLDLWGVPPEHLTLEVTETSILADADVAAAIMVRLHEVGARLSIDDFGTGHSSLARLRDLPLDELKIDRLFVAGMTSRVGDRQIVRSVIDLAHNFDLKAVAEGVEDDATVEALLAVDCDVIQGFRFARPMDVRALRTWWPGRERLRRG